jgi:hypothetical protein
MDVAVSVEAAEAVVEWDGEGDGGVGEGVAGGDDDGEAVMREPGKHR